MRIMILGGHGFIGKNLKEILGRSHEILDFSRTYGYDLRDFNKSREVFLNFIPDIIYHLASHGGSLHYVTEFAADVINDNIMMSLNLYNIVKDLKNNPSIINTISNCSYPGNTQIQKEPEWLSGPVHDSVFSFANSKRVLYYISNCYYRQYDVKSINLIFSNAFGINDHVDPNKTHAIDGLIIRMIKAKRAGEKVFEVWGTGNPVREWVYVEDICKILMLAKEYGQIINPVNVAQNRGYSIKESVEIIKRLSGYTGDIKFNIKYQDGDAVKILDNSQFKNLFKDYVFTDHEEALRRTIRYYEEIL